MQQVDDGIEETMKWDCPEITVLVRTTATEAILSACKSGSITGPVTTDYGCTTSGPVCSICYDLGSS